MGLKLENVDYLERQITKLDKSSSDNRNRIDISSLKIGKLQDVIGYTKKEHLHELIDLIDERPEIK